MPTIEGPTTVSAQTPTLNISKEGFVIGNDVQWQRAIQGLLPGDTPINGWLTIKSSPAATDISGVQVMITTTTSIGGPGVIQLSGGLWTAYFNMTGQATLVLHYGPLYYYDIKVQASPSTRVYTVEQGWIQFLPEIGDQPFPGNASINLPPLPPAVLFGTNPPPAGVFAIGTRYWVVPPTPGFPSTWVFADDSAWHVESVVSN